MAKGWSPDMHALADRVMQKVSDTGDHVDVFEAIGAIWNAETDSFNKISHAMYFEQKAMMREFVIQAVGERTLHITGIGSAISSRQNIVMHEGRNWCDLSPVFCAATVNLNVTPWLDPVITGSFRQPRVDPLRYRLAGGLAGAL